MRIEGTVKRQALSGGVWTFRATDGQVYQLHGGGKDLLRDGVEAELEGDVQKDVMTIGMVGPVFRVRIRWASVTTSPSINPP